MTQDFALWAACQRLFNVTPALVEDLRADKGEVRFLATARNWSGSDLDDLYDDEDKILAIGYEDEEGDDRLVAVEEFFMGVPCIVVARTLGSYLEDDTRALDVTVFVTVSDETRNQAIERVKAESLEDYFANHWQERQDAVARAAEVARKPAAQPPVAPASSGINPQGKSLFQRWFGK
ncbi:hypothetical protein WJ96_04240 [Burkholderia ubonensis]|uniref:Uncharacterized protein n=1 Tax=Burkholderia ubonensis TaxID=101571 RepID=A0AAW3MXR5_9BURK|nr:hypothetical protein [Burkholderia ubonensis]KVP65584.1 hypothetical protein WJ93_23985 [Burkholderia ubonensis]KVP96440.1 hypothetical protein WJ97_11155 [Burkholderia ubonensis]KVP97785.1 hypothetical protein WJ96_04240 [Burkholderia ubonensis]KVZ92482.1 hypothetical protein WL25_15895 [Burkholderia ubonensis]